MNKIEKTLKSGRKVVIKELSLDKIAELEDIQFIEYDNSYSPPRPNAIRNVHKSKLAWIREGLTECGGWVANGVASTPDSIIKKLSGEEREELVSLIQESQDIDEKKV